MKTRCLGNERFLSSDEYYVKERNERKEETEKYHGVFYRIVGFTGKRFLFSPPPPPPAPFLFFLLSLSLSNFRSNNSIGNALLAFVLCAAAACCVACSDHCTFLGNYPPTPPLNQHQHLPLTKGKMLP